MNVALRPFRILSLFAGGGGLDLGLHLAIHGAQTVCYVEREAYAAATLVARMEEAALAPAPVWDDVCTFDGRPWRGLVDCVAGGFPCQDISNAGKREGIGGERSGLWREYARIVGEVRPRYVFVENVAALAVRGLDTVLADLAALGFDAEWGVVGADDAGAPHQRDRIFVLVHLEHATQLGRREGRPEHGLRGGRRTTADAGGQVAPAILDGLERQEREELDDARGRRHDASALRSGRTVPWPPGPEDAVGWRAYLEEWPGLEPAVRRGADGLAYRVERLRLLGNGVVPAQAALAWRVLHERLRGI